MSVDVKAIAGIADLSAGLLSTLGAFLKHVGSLGKNGDNTVAFKVGHIFEQVAAAEQVASQVAVPVAEAVAEAVKSPPPGQVGTAFQAP